MIYSTSAGFLQLNFTTYLKWIEKIHSYRFPDKNAGRWKDDISYVWCDLSELRRPKQRYLHYSFTFRSFQFWFLAILMHYEPKATLSPLLHLSVLSVLVLSHSYALQQKIKKSKRTLLNNKTTHQNTPPSFTSIIRNARWKFYNLNFNLQKWQSFIISLSTCNYYIFFTAMKFVCLSRNRFTPLKRQV